jgi:hypothetical protein
LPPTTNYEHALPPPPPPPPPPPSKPAPKGVGGAAAGPQGLSSIEANVRLPPGSQIVVFFFFFFCRCGEFGRIALFPGLALGKYFDTERRKWPPKRVPVKS